MAGTAYSFFLGNGLRFLPDESDYYAIAKNFATTGNFSINGIDPTAARPPGYPFVLAVLAWLGGNIIAARMLNYVFLAVSIVWLNQFLKSRFSPLTASLGVLMAAAYGVFFFTAGVLYPQIMCGLLILIAVDFLTRNQPKLYQGVFSGLAIALLILAVPTFVFVPIIFIGWFVLYRLPLKPLWVSLAVTVLILGLWTWRNYATFHSFTFVSTHSGRVLLYGNSENTTPSAGATADISKYEMEAQQLGLNETETDRYLANQAITYIINHPLRSLVMYLAKFVNNFNFRNDLVTSSESSTLRDLIMFITYYPMLSLFFLRWFFIKKYPIDRQEILWMLLYIGNGLVYAIFITRIRFRLPLDWMLIISAALFLARIVQDRSINEMSLFKTR